MLSVLTFNASLLEINILGAKMAPVSYVKNRLKYLWDELLKLDSDIIALQEVYSIEPKKHLINKLKIKYPYYWYNKKSSLVWLDSGLITFSKYPILETKFKSFDKNTIDEGIFVNKGFLISCIDIRDLGPIYFYNTHVSAWGLFLMQDSIKANNIRESQINQIIDHISRLKTDKSILFWDFNCWPEISKKNYELIIKRWFIDTYQYNSNSNITWDSNNTLNIGWHYSSSPSQRIDHIFTNNKMSFKETSSKIVFIKPIVNICDDKKVCLSDHYWLLVNFKI